MQRIGRSRLPPAKTLCRMALCIDTGTCVSGGRRRSSVESINAHPETRVSFKDSAGEAPFIWLRRSGRPRPETCFRSRKSVLLSTFNFEILQSKCIESKPGRGRPNHVTCYFPVDFSSVRASKGCAWSLPPCFIRISTFPSAASSSWRQALDSRTPSSNSLSDCSSDRSPRSNCSTIFSSCCRQSSNLGKQSLHHHCKGLTTFPDPDTDSTEESYGGVAGRNSAHAVRQTFVFLSVLRWFHRPLVLLGLKSSGRKFARFRRQTIQV